MRQIDISEQFPEILEKVREFQVLASSENPEFNDFLVAADKTLNNFYIDSLDADGCSRWERLLGVHTLGNLKERRFRIKALLNARLPYTYKKLQTMIDALCGEGTYTITLEAWELNVILSLGVKRHKSAISEMFDRVLPAAVEYIIDFDYNRWGDVAEYTWGDLEALTWGEVYEEVLP